MHGLEAPEDGCLYEMLEAHLSPQYVAKPRSQLVNQECNDGTSLQNLWVLSPSVHKAFRQGHLYVRLVSRTRDSPEFTMRELDEDKLDAMLRRSFSLGFIDACQCIHLFYVEDKASRGWPRSIRDQINFDIPILRKALPSVMALYTVSVGRWLYGPSTTPYVQRLPFGLHLVWSMLENMPARYIYHLRGQMIHEVMHLMSYEERDRLADELGSYAEQLRKISNPSPFLFCNTLGAKIVDHRLPDRSGGPFHLRV
ncbi:hypothetical protein TSTA_113640 [Talaromyces stipitatus ATCC 10500]|uniref:Uncharacterized protein n=1 Tax=Talaromyces stipitatus (strain ATCC 10500 / CBS 375.48 / QM 6759 / NRRL 1006) TaxID=441959 RepID=B8MD14_TALSN|nr:uncharacterized protein TSTA_113640 [Talaromyces stipitatus ATCC 10500]XP_002481533.1 uncharacterized protein TSTA_113640 [Talaromyces stipitatus ATCC 10500]EED17540.1 hypothetical protein TSTA_113640 [Talaromyces stipitatus ATCC 10500]EED17541.1 hypothetical protein TSTA_113640 [Talaromyces stipitatus ATCC 10500]